jgi:hypothetical protein
MSIWSILRPLEVFNSHLVYFVAIWLFFPVLVWCTQLNSGNPGQTLAVEKSSPQKWTSLISLKNVPKVNCHPMGENSHNLVTLNIMEWNSEARY